MNPNTPLHLVRASCAWLFILCFLSFTPTFSWAAEIFGTIELTEGSVSVIDAQGQTRLPLVQDKLLEGDTVVTGRDGEVHIRTEDHGFVAVRPATKFRVDAYLAHGDSTDKSVMSLLVGSVRSITGWIGKYHPDAYAIKTPSATIGVRGTDHEPHVILPPEPGQSAIGEPGTYDKVNQGSTVMRSDKGSIDIRPNQAGFAGQGATEGPKTLAAIPSFYKPSRREARIERRKENLSQNLEKHHENRIKQSTQKTAQKRVQSPPKPGPRAKVQRQR